MNQNETLENLRTLIEAYSDIKIVEASHRKDTTYIDFRTKSQSSLARIAYACEASNVLLTVGAPVFQYGYGKPMKSDNLYYVIRIPDDEEELELPSTAQTLGIFLARDLKALGLVSAGISDTLQKKWNAMIM